MQLQRIIALSTLLLGALAHAQVYKWVDEDGVVHFSDQPRAGAEELNLPATPAPRVQPGPRASAAADAASAEEEEAAPEPDPGYESLAVVSPAAEETLWNIGGTLNVTLALQPGLKPGHQVRIYFDGAVRTVSGTSFQLPEVYRGMHNIQAEIVDEAGELQIRSVNHRFYVQQTSVVGRPNAPR